MKAFQDSQNECLDLEFDRIWSVRRELALKEQQN